MKKFSKKKHKTRKIILQNLYGIEITENKNIDLNAIHNQLNKNKIDFDYLIFIIKKIIEKEKIIMLIINTNTKTFLNIDLIEKIILKISVFELFFNKKISEKIILNESINLSKQFCAKNSYILINKILDTIVKNT